MKSSPLIQLLESFFTLFLFIIGGIFLTVGLEPSRMWKLKEWLEASQSHCIWVGCAFIGVAVLLTWILVRLYSVRYLEIKLYRPRGKVELEPSALKEYILEFWSKETLFPHPSQVNVTKGGLISITANAPFKDMASPLDREQKQLLLNFERKLIDTMDKQLGYGNPIVLRWILAGDVSSEE